MKRPHCQYMKINPLGTIPYFIDAEVLIPYVGFIQVRLFVEIADESSQGDVRMTESCGIPQVCSHFHLGHAMHDLTLIVAVFGYEVRTHAAVCHPR